jgi:3'-phosphoadenosine 5'-phosphosulfate sulfotransferase (PAPS reductase)/FAD synthetase
MFDPFKIDSRTAISMSGGRTSAYMLWRVLQSNGGLPDGVEVCFANTGKEMEETLEFVRAIEVNWNVPIRWIEYRDDDQGYALVNFETASRNGEPFKAIVQKRNYLPNPVTRFCTVELKIRAMHKHLKSLGWKDKDSDGWEQMVGIRADEQRRVAKIRARPSPETSKETMILPLADAGITKKMVGDFWKSQPFDLGLFNNNGQTMHGNCDLCFLKGANQVFTLIKEKPERAIWWASMESLSLSLSSKPSGAVFRSDRPSYQQMHDYALDQDDMFDDAEDESIACFCGD